MFEESIKANSLPPEFENDILAHNGEMHLIEWTNTMLRNAEKMTIGAASIGVDITERKQTEEKLQLFRNLIDKSNDAIFVNDPYDGMILDVNDKACNDLGYSREELLKMHVFDFAATIPDQFTWKKHAEEVLKKGFMVFEGSLRCKDGMTYPVEVNVKNIVLGKKNYMVAMVRDITERKKSQEALRKSQARLFEAQRLAHIGNWEWDIRTNELFWSEENYRIYGISRDVSLYIELFYKYVHPDYIDFVKRSINDALNKTKPYDIDMRIIRPDGQKRTIHAKADVDFDASGKPVRMFGTAQDITDRKLAEEELILKAKLLDRATDSIFVHDRDGNFIYINEAAYKSRGYTRDELMGMKVHDLVIPEFAGHVNQRINTVLENGEYVYESANFRKNGSIVPVEVHSSIFNFDGNKLILAITRDITERKEAEKLQREKAMAELNGFIVSALPVFASNVPSYVRNNLVRNFAERFDKNIRPRFEEESKKLTCGLSAGESNERIPEILDIFMLWLERMFSNIGIKTDSSFEKTGHEEIRINFEFLNCPWKGDAKGNPVFCFICRTMVFRSYTWTKQKGSALQKSSIADGSKTCRFEIHTRSLESRNS